MYRKRNGSLSFSFSRLVSNAIPNFASDGAGMTTEVHPIHRDMLYMHQLAAAEPELLDERSFYVAGVCDRERQSERIFMALLKNGVISPEGAVDTYKIGPKFTHQLAFIPQVSQRNLINVLFLWEEEVHRLRKLGEEEAELTTMISEAETQNDDAIDREAVDQLKFARERVRMKRRQRPSQRNSAIEADTDATVAEAFHPRRESSGKAGEMPPAYTGL